MATRISLVALTAVFFGISASTVAAKDGSAISVRLSTKRPAVEYLVAKPISTKKTLDKTQSILPIFTRQSQSPQPIVIRNYYLTARAKKEVLPFWQGPRPVRLQNQFYKIGLDKSPKNATLHTLIF